MDRTFNTMIIMPTAAPSIVCETRLQVYAATGATITPPMMSGMVMFHRKVSKPNVTANVATIAEVVKNSAKFTEPITYRGSVLFAATSVDVQIGPHPPPPMASTAPPVKPKARRKPLEQIHFCLGTRGLAQNHPDRYAAYTLNTLLGGGVSSRLFQEVRENKGWAYSIYSVLSSYKDAGLFSVYAATSLETALKAIRLVLKEIKQIKEKGVNSTELDKAKGHMKGSLMLSLESTNSRMIRLAKDEIYFGRYVSLDEILKAIDRVSPRKIQKLAEELFDPQLLTLTTLGPLAKKDLPDNLLRC